MSEPRYKAGPKSAKPPQYNLGDSSDESSDKENSQKQIVSTEPLPAFQTPSVEVDATDYNLEYTSNALPERISTTQSQNSIQRKEISNNLIETIFHFEFSINFSTFFNHSIY